jgi:hypothetical protein
MKSSRSEAGRESQVKWTWAQTNLGANGKISHVQCAVYSLASSSTSHFRHWTALSNAPSFSTGHIIHVRKARILKYYWNKLEQTARLENDYTQDASPIWILEGEVTNLKFAPAQSFLAPNQKASPKGCPT